MLLYAEVARFSNCSSVTTSFINMMRGLLPQSTSWLPLVLAHHVKGRVVRDLCRATGSAVPRTSTIVNVFLFWLSKIEYAHRGGYRLHSSSWSSIRDPSTIIDRTLLHVWAGLNPGVTLDAQTRNVQGMCKKSTDSRP